MSVSIRFLQKHAKPHILRSVNDVTYRSWVIFTTSPSLLFKTRVIFLLENYTITG